eukprot:CAMPEP_0175709914 /NCGR_PEP_ID=MMETSP0097-20121207/39816_1 /TAXON_ID=311494 /ORGANISM="Alexandrium monilatum, Strain CCMP3105" /LENGTH=225 /DNA_ID=CAMNT_0017017325 /DNA_START=44 /DNA_END=719 /DNA_ORIENTATION=-
MSRGNTLPDISGMTSLKVDCSGSLPDRWNVEELRRLFEKYGDVGDVFIPREKYSDRSRGFAFVRFFDERDAKEAIKDLNGFKLQGSMLTVSKANRSREEARAETMPDHDLSGGPQADPAPLAEEEKSEDAGAEAAVSILSQADKAAARLRAAVAGTSLRSGTGGGATPGESTRGARGGGAALATTAADAEGGGALTAGAAEPLAWVEDSGRCVLGGVSPCVNAVP